MSQSDRFEEAITNLLQGSSVYGSLSSASYTGGYKREIDGESKYYEWTLSVHEAPDPDDVKENEIESHRPSQVFGYYK
jgi:hypothetical protein